MPMHMRTSGEALRGRHGQLTDTTKGSALGENDRKLIAAIARRDKTAFRDLHLRYDGRIRRFVSRTFPRCTSTEEIASDTLWIVWRSAGQFKGTSQVSTWIMGIAHNVSLKRLRESTHRLTELRNLKTPEDAREARDNPWTQLDLRDWVAVALARLPEEQRMVLELAYHFGHSCAEIAVTMNCPVGTVKTRMYHGRQKLKYLLPVLAGLNQNTTTIETNRGSIGVPFQLVGRR
jgi:RNA polymerase sigma-70 factor, ECF subfamily